MLILPSCVRELQHIRLHTHTPAGFSLITNMVIFDYDSDQPAPNHQEVIDTADQRAKDMQLLVKTVVSKMFRQDRNDPQ